MTALRMATLNAAECFGLKDRGGFAPGLRADIVLVNNVRDFKISRVVIKGKLAAEERRFFASMSSSSGVESALRGSFHVKDFSIKKLAMSLDSEDVRVIDIKPASVVTGNGRAKVRLDSSRNFAFDPAGDIAKIAVVERHKNTGNVGLGLIRGYGIQRGAVAISVAHDSHNIIAAGTNDADMAAAVQRVIAMGGGAALVMDGTVIEDMPLPLGGILSDQNGEWVDAKLTSLQRRAVEELGVNKDVEPLMTLCFMSLPVIPELKITDMGLFDTAAFDFVPVSVQR
jgi:adenine deaminase